MPVRYSRQIAKTGASIGTVISIPKPTTWVDSANLATESLNWNIANNYPGWLECDGRTLNVSDYRILYSVIGNTYGGTVGSTFKLPDYRSKKLMGTGVLNGNIGAGLSISPNISATGVSGGAISEPGSQGGLYSVSTVRQLPPGSEITPGTPLGADVSYDVNDNFLTSRENLIGTARINHGTGLTEVGGFAQPNITNGGRYLAFSTPTLTPFNSLRNPRRAIYTNLNLTEYSQLIVYCIAGNDTNGGERPNNVGEQMEILWPDGSTSLVLPSFQGANVTIDEYDILYTAWREQTIDIPGQFRTNNVTIEFRQQVVSVLNTGGSSELDGASVVPANHPNGTDSMAIQRIRFRGGALGGQATDTFSLGTFVSAGFSSITSDVQPNFSGTLSFSAGSSTGTEQRLVPTAPAHDHYVRHVRRGNSSAAEGSPYAYAGRIGFLNNTNGSVLSYDRSGSPIRQHSHYICWGTAPSASSYGNDEGPGGSLVNGLINPSTGFAHGTQVADFSNNIGTTINKTIDLVNQAGVTLNPGTFTLKNSSRTDFDNALSVRLEAAEEIPLMSPYFRLKYIIKAY